MPITPLSDDTKVANTETKRDRSSTETSSDSAKVLKEVDDSGSGLVKRRGIFRRGSKASAQSSQPSSRSLREVDDEDDSRQFPIRPDHDDDWGIADDMRMVLG